MKNPLFNMCNNSGLGKTMAQFSPERLKTALSSQGPDFLQKMVNVAKQKGISQTDIDAGLRMLKAI